MFYRTPLYVLHSPRKFDYPETGEHAYWYLSDAG
jgi:hypothetical protein